jgi:NitT/TauT family transport system permease protein
MSVVVSPRGVGTPSSRGAGTALPRRGAAARPPGHLLGTVGTILALVVLWYVAARLRWISVEILPGPGEVLGALRDLANDGEVYGNIASTLARILLSFALGFVLGLPLGVVLWRSAAIGAALRPYLSAAYSVPLVVFYPFLLVVLGLNDWPVVVLTTVITAIPIALNTEIGLRETRKVLMNVGRALECAPVRVFRHILLPSAWPSVLAGLKLSMVYAVVGVVSMEFVAAQSGVGNRIQHYYELFDSASMYAFILLTLLVSGACVALVLVLEAVTMRGRR